MSFDTKSSFMQLINGFTYKPIGKAMTNPLTLSLLLTIIIMLIIIYSYDCDHKFRTLFRIFSITTIFLFINNHILLDDMKSSNTNKDQDAILRDVEGTYKNYNDSDIVVPKNIEQELENN